MGISIGIAAVEAANASQMEALANVELAALTDDAALFFLAEDAALAGRPDPEALYLERLFPAKARMQVDSLARWSLRDDLRILRQTLASLWSPAARAESARAMQELLAGCPPAN